MCILFYQINEDPIKFIFIGLHTSRHKPHTQYSFRIFLYRLFKSTNTQRRSRLQHWCCVGVDTPKCYRQLSEGLAQGPYMADRVLTCDLLDTRCQPTTEPARPTHCGECALDLVGNGLAKQLKCHVDWLAIQLPACWLTCHSTTCLLIDLPFNFLLGYDQLTCHLSWHHIREWLSEWLISKWLFSP